VGHAEGVPDPPTLERHRGGHAGWWPAAVLGADDGIVSTASLMLGVATRLPVPARPDVALTRDQVDDDANDDDGERNEPRV
jgi:hypothetical protein